MKFVLWAVILLGALVGGSLIAYGIQSGETGFYLWAGFLIVAAVLAWWKMKQLRENPPSEQPLQ